ncbi:MAG: Crp/Fnr family transcriptional regulator [Saprospiraceae bacterium]|nr:Crp/Fnr family transcriptional regulator [Saprospiraceae bacterium]
MEDFKKFFDGLTEVSDQSWSKFTALFKPDQLVKGEYFISEGQLAKNIGFLSSGVIRAFYRNSEGEEYNKHFFIGPCFIGGYASLITQKPNQINQQALTSCELLVAKYADILSLYQEHQDLERAGRVLAEQFFVQKETREIQLVLMDADKRYEIFREEFPGLEQLIPQYHIASFLGITPTQLSRIRKKMSSK